MIEKWRKIWWLGGDLNTRPRDYDFYVVIARIWLKTADFLNYTAFTLSTLTNLIANFYTQESAQGDYSLKVLTVQ